MSLDPSSWSVPGWQQLKRDYNIVKRLLVLPCSNPVGVYVELAAEAAIKMAWSIADPDLKELFHKATGNSAYHTLKAGIEDMHDAAGSPFPRATRFLGKVGLVPDVGLWGLFLFGVASQGLTGFSSQILKIQPCANKGDRNYGTGGSWIAAIHDNGEWSGMEFGFNDGSKFDPVSGSQVFAQPHATALVAASATFEDLDGNKVGTGSRIYTGDDINYLDIDFNADTGETPTRPTHVWYKSRSQFAETTHIQAQWQYTGQPLPLGEAFAIGSTMSCYLYEPA